MKICENPLQTKSETPRESLKKNWLMEAGRMIKNSAGM